VQKDSKISVRGNTSFNFRRGKIQKSRAHVAINGICILFIYIFNLINSSN